MEYLQYQLSVLFTSQYKKQWSLIHHHWAIFLTNPEMFQVKSRLWSAGILQSLQIPSSLRTFEPR